MTSSSLSFEFTSRCHVLVRVALPGAMHCGWGAGIGIGSVDDLIL